MVPAGKSTGKGEAPVVVTVEALQNVKEIEKVLIQKGFTVFDQVKADKLMVDNLEK
jgi:enolase